MSFNDDFINDLNYVDGITIIDDRGNIIFSVKFNPILNPNVTEEEAVIGKHLYEAFTNLDDSSSTLVKTLMLNKPIAKKSQEVIYADGKSIKTTNLSLPIKAGDNTIGAIEISKDISKLMGDSSIIKIDKVPFSNIDNFKKVSNTRAKYQLDDIISENNSIKEIKYNIQNLYATNIPIFIYGETGTGKELFAQSIHNTSIRKNKPFIPINCAAIPESLLEGILFGTSSGSFTGAIDNPGLFELAQGGSLYLDEINSMPINIQSKLLRVLEDGYIRRLGSKLEKKVDVRIISSSNIKADECIRQNLLRQDIYYRLCVMNIEIPPLRERPEDIKLMMNYFISTYNALLNKNINNISKDVYSTFMNYNWPGNVRELKHIIEYAMNIVSPKENQLGIHHIDSKFKEIQSISSNNMDLSKLEIKPLNLQVENLEKIEIHKALTVTKGNVSRAANILEIPRQTLKNKIDKYKIDMKTFKLPKI